MRPLAVCAQQNARPVIGYLAFASVNNVGAHRMLSAFREGLGEAGYAEGRNIAIEYRWAETHADLSGLPRHRKVDVIMTGRAFGDRREAGDLPLLRAALRRPRPSRRFARHWSRNCCAGSAPTN